MISFCDKESCYLKSNLILAMVFNYFLALSVLVFLLSVIGAPWYLIDCEYENIFELRQDEKENKYHGLIEEISECSDFKTEYCTVVVSSLGHVTERTKQNMIKLFVRTRGKNICEKPSLSTIRRSTCTYYDKLPSTFSFTSADELQSSNNDKESSHN